MSTDNIRDLAAALIAALEPFADSPAEEVKAEPEAKTTSVVKKTATKKTSKPAVVKTEPKEEEAVEEEGKYTEESLKSKRISELREIALSLDYDEEEVADAKKPELIAAILDDMEEDDEDDYDEDDEDDEEEEEESDDFEDMSLAELRAEAKKAGIDGRKVRHMDRDDIIAALTDDDEEEDDEEEDDEEYDDDRTHEEPVTEEELNELSLPELKEAASLFELELPKRARRTTIVQMILERQDELLDDVADDYDDEEDEDDE